MSVAKKIRDNIAANVKLSALGNSNRSLRDVCIDLINASGLYWEDIADGTYLCRSTIGNLAKDITQNPQLQTIERIMKFFDCRVDINGEVVKGINMLQPKTKTPRKKKAK
jgi:transcriptional regulator with XRE-family HTH domain